MARVEGVTARDGGRPVRAPDRPQIQDLRAPRAGHQDPAPPSRATRRSPARSTNSSRSTPAAAASTTARSARSAGRGAVALDRSPPRASRTRSRPCATWRPGGRTSATTSSARAAITRWSSARPCWSAAIDVPWGARPDTDHPRRPARTDGARRLRPRAPRHRVRVPGDPARPPEGHGRRHRSDARGRRLRLRRRDAHPLDDPGAAGRER